MLGGVAEFVVSCELRDGRTVWTTGAPERSACWAARCPRAPTGRPSGTTACTPTTGRCSTKYLERLAQREPAEATYRLRGLDGVERWVWARARPHPGDGPVAYDAVISDVTERERARIGLQLAREEAERRSRVDPTTGLFNRHHLLDVARRELARSQREHTSPALVLLDVDRLRELNERRGHAVGDAVLRELAGRLSHSVRTYDTISHVGGGRFAVLVPDLRDGEALRRICDEIAAIADGGAAALGRSRAARDGLGGRRARASRHDRRRPAAHRRGRARRGQAQRPRQAGGHGQPARSPPRTSTARPRASPPRSPARPPCARACRTSTRSASPSSPSSSAASSACPRALQGDLRLAGLLHDVGTIAVAGAVLSKPGRSTRRSGSCCASTRASAPTWSRASRASRGRSSRSATTTSASTAQGYPDRLAGEAIPMAARVLAAVDAYTAMTENRPYRDARDRGEALEELRRNAGTQLDPAVVDALCRVLAGESAGAVAA